MARMSHSGERHERRPLLIAHRGDSRSFPENTHAAFAAALDAGVDAVELDVRLTADGVPVVCHDATLARFGAGHRPIVRRSLLEVRHADVGRWFAPAFAGETVPTLAAVLDQCRAIEVFIELKAVGGRGSGTYHRKLVRAVVELIRRKRAAKRVLILCFNGSVLARVARAAPRLRRVRNCERLPRDLDGWLDRQIGLTAVCFDQRVVDERVVRLCRQRGLRVFAYTCNDERVLRRLSALGIDGLLSDRADWLVRAARRS